MKTQNVGFVNKSKMQAVVADFIAVAVGPPAAAPAAAAAAAPGPKAMNAMKKIGRPAKQGRVKAIYVLTFDAPIGAPKVNDF